MIQWISIDGVLIRCSAIVRVDEVIGENEPYAGTFLIYLDDGNYIQADKSIRMKVLEAINATGAVQL
jgi:hypothetical protein